MVVIRKIRAGDVSGALTIVNEAAKAYRGVISADCWRDPYMQADALEHEMADGVDFWVAEQDGCAVAVMGIQDKGEVALIRHAYVKSGLQRRGLGTRLLRHVEGLTRKPFLVGTWADASRAIGFYQRNGYTLVPSTDKDGLLRSYWSIPARQIETSVVLANRRWIAARQRVPTDH